MEKLWETCVPEYAEMLVKTKMNEWEQIKKNLATRISNEAYQNWLVRTSFQQCDGSNLWVSVPNEATKAWMESEYAEWVESAIRELNLPISSIRYELAYPASNGNSHSDQSLSPEALFSSPTGQLNGKFTFGNFVVGPCNQFAHAAAKAVAKAARVRIFFITVPFSHATWWRPRVWFGQLARR